MTNKQTKQNQTQREIKRGDTVIFGDSFGKSGIVLHIHSGNRWVRILTSKGIVRVPKEYCGLTISRDMNDEAFMFQYGHLLSGQYLEKQKRNKQKRTHINKQVRKEKTLDDIERDIVRLQSRLPDL